MQTLFDNAVISIQLGMEDFKSHDRRRAFSSIRNFYSGVLLLVKEKLVRLAPEDDPYLLISKKTVATKSDGGGAIFKSAGKQTLDRYQLLERLRQLSVNVDANALNHLAEIRNEIEHRFPSQPHEALKEAIAGAFPLVVNLLRDHLDTDPADALGDAWTVMLATRALYEEELRACRQTLANVSWLSGSVEAEELHCPECGSKLVAQADPHNSMQEDMDLSCRACGASLTVEETIVATLKAALEYETYLRAKDAEEGPIHDCPECVNPSYVDFEGKCAICGCEIEEQDCARCGTTLSFGEITYGSGGLCSWCDHMAQKIMRE